MTRIQRAGRSGLVTAAFLVTLSCGDDEGPVGSTGSIQLTVNPATIAAPQGGNGLVTATLTRNGGYTGAVTVAVTGLPAGATSVIEPTQLSGTTTSANVTVSVGAGVVTGTYPVTVSATGQGVDAATSTYQLTVTAAPDFALTVTPASLRIPAGASGSATVNIARTNFTGAVALSLLNAPTGVTSTFDQTPSATNASMLLVSVPATVAPGTYTLTVQGTAPPTFLKTATVALEVTAPTTGTRVEYAFCDAGSTPVFVAYQDGSGAWQPVSGATTGSTTRFDFNIAQGRGGVMFVYRYADAGVIEPMRVGASGRVRRETARRAPFREAIRQQTRRSAVSPSIVGRASLVDSYETFVIYASTEELVADAATPCVPAEDTKTVTGTVAGVTAGQYGVVSLGGSTTYFDGAASTNPVSFTDVPAGAVDFVGARIVTPGQAPDRIIMFRNLDIPDGGALPSPIDFNGPATSLPAVANATITGAGGTDELEIFVEVVTANSSMLLWSDLAPSTTAVRPWAGLGPSVMAAGDIHGLLTFASTRGGPPNFRVAGKYVGPVSAQTLALGPALPAPTISQVAGGAYPRYRFQGTFAADYSKTAYIETVGDGNYVSFLATGAYLTASQSPLAYDFVMPDVAGLAGFPTASRLSAGVNDVAITVLGFTGPGIFNLPPTVGGEFKGATRGATITVP